jgi:hypothetical protein
MRGRAVASGRNFPRLGFASAIRSLTVFTGSEDAPPARWSAVAISDTAKLLIV